jgi:hypothetical protein
MTTAAMKKRVEELAKEWELKAADVYGGYGHVKRKPKKARKECAKYIKDQLKKESLEDGRSGGFLLSLILPYIIRWVVSALIKRLVNKNT